MEVALSSFCLPGRAQGEEDESRAAWRRISPTLTSRVPSIWKATGWRSGMARLGGVCWNVCADLVFGRVAGGSPYRAE
jgi:hypothetical protein